ncbi:MAG: hypothetical protein NC078_11595 [Ruminococcus sp.]|nr:hypothetical protein [Ruminococcus sp.]
MNNYIPAVVEVPNGTHLASFRNKSGYLGTLLDNITNKFKGQASIHKIPKAIPYVMVAYMAIMTAVAIHEHKQNCQLRSEQLIILSLLNDKYLNLLKTFTELEKLCCSQAYVDISRIECLVTSDCVLIRIPKSKIYENRTDTDLLIDANRGAQTDDKILAIADSEAERIVYDKLLNIIVNDNVVDTLKIERF